jgi:Spy/CpxP family protein refolding chaperone
MKSAKVFGLLTLLLTVALGTTAYAQGCWGGGGGWYRGRGAAPPALTAEQQKQVDSIRLNFLKRTEGLRSEMRKRRLELMELQAKKSPDEKAIDQVRQEIWGLQDKMIKERRAMSRELDAVLPPGQRRGLGGFGPGFCKFGGPGRGRGFGRGFGGCPGWSRVF